MITMKSWWWVAAFCTLIGGIYARSYQEKKTALCEYSFLLQEKEKEMRFAMQEREELKLKILSQSDPAWIEMILMRELGVVPEGWLKVHFKK